MNEQNSHTSLSESDPRYKWYITFCTMIGTLMVIMDTVIVNVGLPKIMASFGVNVNTALMYVSPMKVGMASGLLNVMRQIGGTFGVALTSTMLEKRMAVHELTMGESINTASMGTQNALSGLQGLLHGSGVADSTTRAASLSLIKQYISGQALVSAFSDCFWIIFVIFIFVVIPAGAIRKKARSPSPEGQS